MKLKDAYSLEGKYDQPRQHIKKQRRYFASKGPSSQGYCFSSGHVWMWEVRLQKAERRSTDAFELWCWRRFLPVRPKGDQSWVFIGRTDAEVETPILWPPDSKGWPIWKDPDAGKGCEWEEKGMTEDEMFGWHHQPDGHELEQSLGGWWWTGKPGMLQSMGS